MGDIVTSDRDATELELICHAHAPIERIEVLNGPDVVKTVRGRTEADLGNRIRVIWQGAEYRGRGRQTRWEGTIRVNGPGIARIVKINAWNHERPFYLDGDTVRFDAITTGNFGGCDLWLDGDRPGRLEIETGLASGVFDLDEIGLDDVVLDAGGLDRKLRIFRLPDVLETLDYTATVPVALTRGRDNPIWVRVTTEDGCNAWSSPIYHIG